MSCTHSYPDTVGGNVTTVQRKFWFIKGNHDGVDVRTYSDYTGRAENHCDEWKHCTLRIRDLRERDSAVYKFRVITNHVNGKYTGDPGVTLFVTDPDLQVLVERSSDQVELKCHSSFKAPPSFVWYKNELKMEEETFSIRVSVNDDNRYSCALKGCEPVMIMNTMRLTLMLLVLITLVVFSLWTRKKKTLSSNPEPKEAVEMMEVDSDPVYENVTTAAQTEDREEQEDLV
ncbi:hypothetical protein INR49_018335 [Caranx melampygus]|nr:hypothetical protein INR49_018335 [Caranx melampygus]